MAVNYGAFGFGRRQGGGEWPAAVCNALARAAAKAWGAPCFDGIAPPHGERQRVVTHLLAYRMNSHLLLITQADIDPTLISVSFVDFGLKVDSNSETRYRNFVDITRQSLPATCSK